MGGFLKKADYARLRVGLRQQRFVASDADENAKQKTVFCQTRPQMKTLEEIEGVQKNYRKQGCE
jgi:hypothetical protein